MEITDDGSIYDLPKLSLTEKNSRLGLLGIKERVEMGGGYLPPEILR